MLPTLIITFREGVEALLIVGISAAYLLRTGPSRLLVWLGLGALTAIAISAILGRLLVELGGMGPLWEGVLALFAMVLIVSCTFHLLRYGRKMKRRIGDELARAGNHRNAAIAVFLFALLMVGREGTEAATMISALMVNGEGGGVIAGGAAGLILAAGLAAAWFVYGRAVNLTLFFNATATFMVLFSLQLIIYAFHEFSEAGVLPLIDNAVWHMRTEPYGPEGEWGVALSYALLAGPILMIVGTRLSNHLQRAQRAAATPDTRTS